MKEEKNIDDLFKLPEGGELKPETVTYVSGENFASERGGEQVDKMREKVTELKPGWHRKKLFEGSVKPIVPKPAIDLSHQEEVTSKRESADASRALIDHSESEYLYGVTQPIPDVAEEGRGLVPGFLYQDSVSFRRDPHNQVEHTFDLEGNMIVPVGLPEKNPDSKEYIFDSLGGLEPIGKSPINEEILTVTFVQGGKSRATWHGKVLEERNLGDWSDSTRMTTDRRLLSLAWQTKFKEKLPLDTPMGISMDGGFSFGTATGIFGKTTPPRRAAGKHSGGKVQKRNKVKAKRHK